MASWEPSGSSHPAYALFLHGGGIGTSSAGTRYLRIALAGEGVASVAFDFSGHGRSGGRLEDATLRQRQQEVRRVVDSLQPAQPRVIIATSMGGHTACRILDKIRPDALVLLCPAAYEARAEDARFGLEFRAVIRSTRTFADSPAFEALSRYQGRVLVVYGSEDEVIPHEVQERYAHAASRASSRQVLRLEGAGHRLHDWLACHASARGDLVVRILSMMT
ncbi:MAG: alpha/beta fold hydrolase [Acidovorax sp.]